VTEYKKGATIPSKTITNSVSLPTGIAFDRSGNLYVANLDSEGAYVAVYAKGSASPSRTITDGHVVNLVTANSANYGNVEEYKSGQSQPYQTITGLGGPVDRYPPPTGRRCKGGRMISGRGVPLDDAPSVQLGARRCET